MLREASLDVQVKQLRNLYCITADANGHGVVYRVFDFPISCTTAGGDTKFGGVGAIR